MTYRLDAVIGDFDRLRNWADDVRGAVVAPLRRRLGLLPLSEPLRDALPRLLGEMSQDGPVAHVVADFWGGSGTQTASLWRDGVEVWGPVRTGDFTGPCKDWPINAVLARLGVVTDHPCSSGGCEPPDDHDDLFLEVGLAGGRDEDDWRWAALKAYDAADYDEWCARVQAEREQAEHAAAERARYERLPSVPVALNGKEVMELLDMPQGRMVGAALRHLQELHLERGPLSREEAVAGLRAWAAEQGTR